MIKCFISYPRNKPETINNNPIKIELAASYIELVVIYVNNVPIKAIIRPKVAAKSSTTIAIKGPSFDSFSNFIIDFFLLFSSFLNFATAFTKT